MVGSDHYSDADDRSADDRNADTLALTERDDGSHSTAGSGYACGMGVSTSSIRRVHRHAARACNVYVCTHMYAGIRPEYSRGTPRGNSRGADIGTDAVLVDSVLTGYLAG